LLRKFVNAEYQ